MRSFPARRRGTAGVAALLLGAALGTGAPALASPDVTNGGTGTRAPAWASPDDRGSESAGTGGQSAGLDEAGGGGGQVTLRAEGHVTLRELARAPSPIRSPAAATADPATEIPPQLRREPDEQATPPAPRLAPNPPAAAVSGLSPATLAFEGLGSGDSRYADGGNQLTNEPGSQALCVGHGYTMEAVANAVAVYDRTGAQLAPPVALSELLGLGAEFNRARGTYGPTTLDPACLYDAQLRRWFFAASALDQDPFTGAPTGGSNLLLAVSTTSDPLGDYARYSIATASGDRTDRGCPCFDDFPRLGTDANGLYISANRFSVFDEVYNGAQVYAVAKAGLAENARAGAELPELVSLDVGRIGGDQSYTVQPAATPPGGAFPGREYFLATTREGARRSDTVGILALSNTDSLNRERPRLRLTRNTVSTLSYVREPDVEQKPGRAPLARLLGEELNALDSATAMSEVEFAQGRLWGATGTAVGGAGAKRDGVLWFQIDPSFAGGRVDGTAVRQGYVSVDTNSLLYPAIGVNADGEGAMVMSMAGPTVYPSPATVRMDLTGTTGPVRVPEFGAAPDDGFTCYAAFVVDRGRGCRWGESSSATADSRGNIWLATRWISGTSRLPLANYTTEVLRVRP